MASALVGRLRSFFAKARFSSSVYRKVSPWRRTIRFLVSDCICSSLKAGPGLENRPAVSDFVLSDGQIGRLIFAHVFPCCQYFFQLPCS